MTDISTRNAPSILSIAAVILAMAAALFSFLAPVYSSGETIADDGGGLFITVLVLGIALSVAPLLVPSRSRLPWFWISGSILILSSFVTVLGMFFIPSGLLLLFSGFLTSQETTTTA